jgi:hypothetical protein
VRIWDGYPALLAEQGRLFAAGSRIRQSRAEWSADKGVQGSFRLVNVSDRPLPVPNFGTVGNGVRIQISVERMGNDPNIPNSGAIKRDQRDQYTLPMLEIHPREGLMPVGGHASATFAFRTQGWPPGKYRIYIEHGWPGDMMIHSAAQCDFVIPD